MTSYLTAAHPGISRLRHRIAGVLDRLECGCVGGGAIDGACMDCGAPSAP